MSGMLIFVLVLIAALIVTLYMVYKKGDSSPASSPAPAPSGPTIDVQGIERTLNPDKSDNGTSPSTSGYVIREYSNGTGNFDYNELTKNVVITLKWDNQGGFDSVKALIAEWQVKGDGDTDYVTRMTKTLNKTNNPDAFKNYSRGNTISFTGNTDLTGDDMFSAVGDNIVHLYYTTSTVTEQQLTPNVDSTNYIPWTINIGDLSATLDMVEPKTYNYVPIKSDISLGRGQTHTNYKIYSKLFKTDISKLLISNEINTSSDSNGVRSGNPDGYIRLIPVVVNGDVQKSKIKLAYVSKEDETVKKGVGVAGETSGIKLRISPRGNFAGFYDDVSEKDATDNPYIGVTDNIENSYIFNIVNVYDGDTVKYIRFQDSVNTDRFMCLRKVSYYDATFNGNGTSYTVQVCLKNASELSFCEKESMDFIMVEGDDVPTFESDAASNTNMTNTPDGECEIYAPANAKYNWRCQKYTQITNYNNNATEERNGSYERREEKVPSNIQRNAGGSYVTCNNGVQE